MNVTLSWQKTGIKTKENDIVIVKVYQGNAVELKIGDERFAKIEKSFYCRTGAAGEISIKGSSEKAKAGLAIRENLRIAAIPFAGGKKGSELGDLAEGIGDAIATRLAEKNIFEIVERVQVDKVIDNLKLENTEFFDQKTTGRIGKVLGTEYLITGSVQKVGSKYRLSAKRIETETGKVIETAIVSGSEGEIFALQDKLAEKLINKIIESEINIFFK